MNKIFFDTNILIYFSTGNTEKGKMARNLLEKQKEPMISHQVMNEFAAACIRKNLLPLDQIKTYLKEFNLFFNVVSMSYSTIEVAFALIEKYSFSFWDALIVASALKNDCNTIYTEDLQHNQKITFGKKHLTVINPFI